MSISDTIVVMNQGVVQQIGRPQDVYDDPHNLFVARFLGTPPINVYDGEIRGGSLYVGQDKILENAGVPDQKVFAGIRPEGFKLNPEGAMHCSLSSIEVMGRDTSVVASHPACQNPNFRAIIGSENLSGLSGNKVCFDVKPEKVHIFNMDQIRIA